MVHFRLSRNGRKKAAKTHSVKELGAINTGSNDLNCHLGEEQPGLKDQKLPKDQKF